MAVHILCHLVTCWVQDAKLLLSLKTPDITPQSVIVDILFIPIINNCMCWTVRVTIFNFWQASTPGSVTPALYQACMTYTLHAKLAPNWNKAGQWLLQGKLNSETKTTTCIQLINYDLTSLWGKKFRTLWCASCRSSLFFIHYVLPYYTCYVCCSGSLYATNEIISCTCNMYGRLKG